MRILLGFVLGAVVALAGAYVFFCPHFKQCGLNFNGKCCPVVNCNCGCDKCKDKCVCTPDKKCGDACKCLACKCPCALCKDKCVCTPDKKCSDNCCCPGCCKK